MRGKDPKPLFRHITGEPIWSNWTPRELVIGAHAAVGSNNWSKADRALRELMERKL